MLNRYPLWKYIILLLMLFLGLLYAIPNFYGEDPAVQITGTRGHVISESMLKQVQNVLKQYNIPNKSIFLKDGNILVRFSSLDLQFRAREALLKELGENYVIALNLAPATPSWLGIIGASPMKLGLDLRGGVYFLMDIDVDMACNKMQKQIMDRLRGDLRDKSIVCAKTIKNKNCSCEIFFSNPVIRDTVFSWLVSRYHRELVIQSTGSNNGLCVNFRDNFFREARESAVRHSITILRNRVNQLGVVEAVVQRQGFDHIVVQLPGMQDTARAKEIIGTTATLEFRLVQSEMDQHDVARTRVVEDAEIKFTSNGQSVLLSKQTILTGEHIIDSSFSTDEYNWPQVNIVLDRVGGAIMSNFTKDNIDKLMATLFIEYKDRGEKDVYGRSMFTKKEEVINIATIKSRIGNSFRITGIKNLNEARQLSLLLRSGTLIAPIKIVEERIIGPTLGIQNINQGFKACFWGLMVSILFMVVWYRKFGLIAISALIVNLILIIGIMSLLPGATLTMPGIAGIVLTLAVAVDANVLINERIKEELRNGRTVQQAIAEGYRGATSSIVDANLTTLITAIILYMIGTSSIKGFAITTVIGIFTSMFTAIVGTRAIVNFLYGGREIDKLSI